MSEPEGASSHWSGIRRRGSVASAGKIESVGPLRPADPIESLRDGLALCTSPRMYVAAFEMDVAALFGFALRTLPETLQAALIERFGSFENLPCGPFSRIYGVLTGLSGGQDSGEMPSTLRVRLIPPYRLPQEFLFMLENASRRAEDDPVKSYWIPLPCVAHGSVTAVDPETALLDHPSVVYRIQDGKLRVEDPAT